MFRVFLRLAACLLVIIVGTTKPVAAQSQSFPYFAFNEGRFDPQLLKKAEATGAVRVAEDSTNVTRVVHTAIEVFERSAVTRDQETYFIQMESRFTLSMLNTPQGGRTLKLLDQVAVEYVKLGFDGAILSPAGSEARTVRFKISRQGNEWTSTALPPRRVAEFYAGLTDHEKRSIGLVVGFLHFNPGRPPVPFRATEGEFFKRTIALFVPGFASQYALEVAEKVTGDAILDALKTKIDAGTLRWGRGEAMDVDSKQYDRFKDCGRAILTGTVGCVSVR